VWSKRSSRVCFARISSKDDEMTPSNSTKASLGWFMLICTRFGQELDGYCFLGLINMAGGGELGKERIGWVGSNLTDFFPTASDQHDFSSCCINWCTQQLSSNQVNNDTYLLLLSTPFPHHKGFSPFPFLPCMILNITPLSNHSTFKTVITPISHINNILLPHLTKLNT